MTISVKGPLLRWGPVLVVMLLIFLASDTPGSSIPEFGLIDFVVKKGGHMAGYALLSMACLHGLTGKNHPNRTRAAAAVAMAVLYAITDEFHQTFTPGRNASITDVGIDAVGATLGVLVWVAIRRWRSA